MPNATARTKRRRPGQCFGRLAQGTRRALLTLTLVAPAWCAAETLEVTPSPCDFGPLQVGQARERSLTVKNVSAAPVQILGVGRFGTDTPNFVIALDLCTGHTLAPGESSRVDVRFQPTGIGAKTIMLRIAGEQRLIIFGHTTFLSGAGKAVPKPPTAGNTPFAEKTAEPVQVATGEFLVDPVTDLALEGPLPLAFVRSYAARLSRDTSVANFGLGTNWMHGFAIRLAGVSTSAVDVIYHGGQALSFAKVAGVWCRTAPAETPFQLREDAAGDFWLLDPPAALVCQFSGAHGGLRRVVDRNYNTLTVSQVNGRPTQVSDGLGRTLTLAYAGDRLTSVTDGRRTVRFGYTGGVLTTVTDAATNTTTYVMTPTALGSMIQRIVYPEGNHHYTQAYDADARVTSQTDACGRRFTHTYDSPAPGVSLIVNPGGTPRHSGHADRRLLTNRTDEAGHALAVDYDAADRPTRVQDRLGHATRLAWHADSGYLQTITNANGCATTYAYEARDQAFTNADADAAVTFTFHDLAQAGCPDGTRIAYTYDARGNPLSRTDRAGQTVRFAYNARGQLLAVTNAVGGVTRFTYDAAGMRRSHADSDTGLTTFHHDALFRLVAVTNPAGRGTGFAYDAKDRLTRVVNERGAVIRYAYDRNGNRVAARDACDQAVVFTYDDMDRLATVRDRTAQTTTFSYDALNRLSTVRDANGVECRNTYAPQGWLQSLSVGDGAWRIDRDAEGVPRAISSPGGRTWQYTTDRLGSVTAATDPLAHGATAARDPMQRVTRHTDALGRATVFAYDGEGRLAAVSNAATGAVRYQRNGLGLATNIVDGNGRSWRLAYSPMGIPAACTDPLGRRTAYAYDALGRLAREEVTGVYTQRLARNALGVVTQRVYTAAGAAPLALAYTYDILDRLVAADGIALAYDAENRLTNAVSAGAAYGAAYDAGGRLARVTYDNGRFAVTYAYDNRNRLASVGDDLAGVTVRFVYDTDNRLVAIRRENGVHTELRWDDGDRLVGLRHGTVADFALHYNAAAQLERAVAHAPLVAAATLASGRQADTFDAASQLASAGYAHDGRGCVTQTPTGAVGWDAGWRLEKLGADTFTCNGFGLHTTRTRGGATRAYRYHHALGLGALAAEVNAGNGQIVRHYVWTPDGQLLYALDGASGAVSYYHFDARGATVCLTDAAGAVTDAYAYAPFGRVLARSGASDQPFTFAGQWGVRQLDDAGAFFCMGARCYDAGAGRFLSRDPFWPVPDDPFAANPYQYARLDPLDLLDPTGLHPGRIAGNPPAPAPDSRRLGDRGSYAAAPPAPDQQGNRDAYSGTGEFAEGGNRGRVYTAGVEEGPFGGNVRGGTVSNSRSVGAFGSVSGSTPIGSANADSQVELGYGRVLVANGVNTPAAGIGASTELRLNGAAGAVTTHVANQVQVTGGGSVNLGSGRAVFMQNVTVADTVGMNAVVYTDVLSGTLQTGANIGTGGHTLGASFELNKGVPTATVNLVVGNISLGGRTSLFGLTLWGGD